MVCETGDRVWIWPIGIDPAGSGNSKRAGTVDTVYSDGTIVVTFLDGCRSLCRQDLYNLAKIDGPSLTPVAN